MNRKYNTNNKSYNSGKILLRKDGNYYNRKGERVYNPTAYMKAVMENKYGFNNYRNGFNN